MPFIDTHCHLDFSEFDVERVSLLRSMLDAGVLGVVLPGVKRAEWSGVMELARSHHHIKYALGLHPYYIGERGEDDLSYLARQLNESGDCVAVGEIGLDLNRPNFDQQLLVFEAQLELAAKAALPVIIHSLKTHDRVAKCFREKSPPAGVVHGFSGSKQQLENLCASGLSIGVGGVITWPRASKTREALKYAPLEALVLETDGPDMPVYGQRDRANSPLNIPVIFHCLLELRSESRAVLEQALWDNACSLFGDFTQHE